MTGNALRYRLYKVLSCTTFALPFAILFALQKDLYLSFASPDTLGVGLGFWGYVMIGFIALGFKKKIGETIKKDPLLSISVGIFLIALIMEFVARQLMMLSGASIAGAILSRSVDGVSDVYFDRAYKALTDNKKVRIHEPLLSNKNAWRLAFGFREV